MNKEGVIGNRLLDELLEEEEFGTVDDRMDTLLEGLHGREGLKRLSE